MNIKHHAITRHTKLDRLFNIIDDITCGYSDRIVALDDFKLAVFYEKKYQGPYDDKKRPYRITLYPNYVEFENGEYSLGDLVYSICWDGGGTADVYAQEDKPNKGYQDIHYGTLNLDLKYDVPNYHRNPYDVIDPEDPIETTFSQCIFPRLESLVASASDD